MPKPNLPQAGGGVGIDGDLPSAESFGMDLEIPSWDGFGSRVLEGTHVLCGIWGFGMRNAGQHERRKELADHDRGLGCLCLYPS